MGCILDRVVDGVSNWLDGYYIVPSCLLFLKKHDIVGCLYHFIHLLTIYGSDSFALYWHRQIKFD